MIQKLIAQWRLNRQSRRLIKSGITIRLEHPHVISRVGERALITTAVNIGGNPALIVGFHPPLMVGEKMTCDRLYQIDWDHVLPVYVAKNLRRV